MGGFFNLSKEKMDTIEERIEKLTPIRNAYVRRFWLPAKFLIMIKFFSLVFRLTGQIHT